MIDGESSVASADGTDLRIFINYRREETADAARLLYDRLAEQFGSDKVFLDVVAIQPGVQWLEALKAGGETAGAFLALIGPRWLSILTDRAQSRVVDHTDDVVKLELELALRRGSGVEVIPVLVGGATMPPADRLPRSIRTLSALQAVELRHVQFDQDVKSLIAALATIQHRPGAAPASGPAVLANEPAPPRDQVDDRPHVSYAAAGAPDDRHYEIVARDMLEEGTVVPLLGSHVWGSLPDAEEIAADLARRFQLDVEPLELPRVAQQVYVSAGRPDLLRTLRQILASPPQPGPVHRFLARFPRDLEQLGLPPRYQMIVTTNYDATVELAFDEENEPYDLAVYVAGGENRSAFVHFPFDGEPEAITVPNRYGKFPIDEYGELQRTVIVKIHGGVPTGADAYRWRENFVITEDHYIDYLSSSPIESLVPVQILAKLTESHCLFLGYTMRDWNVRVFLKRIWRGEPLGARSWAIERALDALERDFWSQLQVECFAVPLDEYVGQLRRRIGAWRRIGT